MHSIQRRNGILCALFVTLLLVSVDQTHGQSSPIDTGLQILQGLSPEQRSAITQGIGGAGTTGVQGAAAPRQTPVNEEQQNLMLQQQRELLIEQQKQRGELQRLSPFLQPEDWVV